jgi:hypothetical protein
MRYIGSYSRLSLCMRPIGKLLTLGKADIIGDVLILKYILGFGAYSMIQICQVMHGKLSI